MAELFKDVNTGNDDYQRERIEARGGVDGAADDEHDPYRRGLRDHAGNRERGGVRPGPGLRRARDQPGHRQGVVDAQLRLAAVNDSALSSTQRNTIIAYKLGALRDIRHILSRPALARLAKIERVAEEVANAGPGDGGT